MKLWQLLEERMLFHSDQIICENDSKLTYEETVVFAKKHLQNLKNCAILMMS